LTAAGREPAGGPETLPEDVRRFVLAAVPSVPYLEALLIFRSTGAALSARALAHRLYTGEERAVQLVAELHAAGLIAPAPDQVSFHYVPASPEVSALVGRLADCYATRLLDVTRLIHSNTERKAQQFADAFRLRKDP